MQNEPAFVYFYASTVHMFVLIKVSQSKHYCHCHCFVQPQRSQARESTAGREKQHKSCWLWNGFTSAWGVPSWNELRLPPLCMPRSYTCRCSATTYKVFCLKTCLLQLSLVLVSIHHQRCSKDGLAINVYDIWSKWVQNHPPAIATIVQCYWEVLERKWCVSVFCFTETFRSVFCWNISVIFLTVVLKLAITAFIA